MSPVGGEFDLIEQMLSRLPDLPSSVRLGPGDDAAVVDRGLGSLVVAADLLIEGRHFDLAFSSPADAGHKAVAVNVSDIAAMGAIPRYVLISIGLPAARPAELADGVYRGIARACDMFAVAVVGGDTVGADLLTLAVTVLGDTEGVAPVSRGGARAGDLVAVTGSIGAAAAGLKLLRTLPDPGAQEVLERFPGLVQAHVLGRARVREGRAAASSGAVAMIDISDGVAADVGHLAEASKVGVAIDPNTIPLAPGVAEAASFLGEDPSALALIGGDDYELAVAGDPAAFDALAEAIAPTPLTIIGRFEPAEGVRFTDGRTVDRLGWDHFA